MIVLKSTAELHLVFNKLIKTLSVPVEWNGNFVISGNFLILPGKERSVIFNYDTRRDRKSTRLNSSHRSQSRMPSSA